MIDITDMDIEIHLSPGYLNTEITCNCYPGRQVRCGEFSGCQTPQMSHIDIYLQPQSSWPYDLRRTAIRVGKIQNTEITWLDTQPLPAWIKEAVEDDQDWIERALAHTDSGHITIGPGLRRRRITT